jgi:hypothetical protein
MPVTGVIAATVQVHDSPIQKSVTTAIRYRDPIARLAGK